MSVHRVPSGGWRVRWREHGQNRSQKFELKSDADAFDREIKRRQQLGPLAVERLTSRGSLTLGEWIERHWMPEHGRTLERSTVGRYASVYKIHIAPTLGQLPLIDLTVSALRKWQADLLAAGIGKPTVHKARTFLSSVLRHAAESEFILANPLSLVRAPKEDHYDSVRPLPPSEVERLIRVLRNPFPRPIAASGNGERRRKAYTLPAPGTSESRRRDALIVSIMAYAGLRPGEVKGLRYGDIGEKTLHIERATDDFGSIKATKNTKKRTIRLLSPLAQDLREYRLAAGRPPASHLIFPGTDDDHSWTKSDWNKWVANRWKPALRAASLPNGAVPYALRHSFASLLLAAGHSRLDVARQLGHTVAVLDRYYSHIIEEFEDTTRIDPEAEIWAARRSAVPSQFLLTGGAGEQLSLLNDESPVETGPPEKYRYRDSNPGYRRERAAS